MLWPISRKEHIAFLFYILMIFIGAYVLVVITYSYEMDPFIIMYCPSLFLIAFLVLKSAFVHSFNYNLPVLSHPK